MSFQCSITLDNLSWEKGMKDRQITSLVEITPSKSGSKSGKIYINYFSQGGLSQLVKNNHKSSIANPLNRNHKLSQTDINKIKLLDHLNKLQKEGGISKPHPLCFHPFQDYPYQDFVMDPKIYPLETASCRNELYLAEISNESTGGLNWIISPAPVLLDKYYKIFSNVKGKYNPQIYLLSYFKMDLTTKIKRYYHQSFCPLTHDSCLLLDNDEICKQIITYHQLLTSLDLYLPKLNDVE